MSSVLDKMRLLAAVGVASLALAACGGGGDSPAQTDPDQDMTMTEQDTQSDGSEDTDADNTDSETPGGGGDGSTGGNGGGGSNGGGDSDNNPGNGNASVCMGDDVAACKGMEMRLLAATTKAEVEAVDTALHEDADDGYRSLPQDQREALFSLVDDRLAALAPLEMEADRIKDAIVYAIDTVGVSDPHPVDMDTADHYGVWLTDGGTPDDPDDNLLTVRFEPPPGKMSGPDFDPDAYMGTASYTGDVKGYAYHQDMADGYKAGKFTADISLDADFAAETITGTVSGFSGAKISPAWGDATLEADRTATTDGTAGGWWVFEAYGVPAEPGTGGGLAGNPDGYVGHMTLRYNDGAAVGAFDAKRQ